MTIKRSFIVRGVAIAAIAFGLVSGVAVASHPSSRHTREQTAMRAKRTFHVMAHSASGAVGLPAEARLILTSPTMSHWGLDVSGTREVSTTAGTANIIPGTGSICFQARNAAATIGGLTCGTLANATAGDEVVVGGTSATGTAFVSGLAPDGVTSVTLHFVDGSAQVVAVTDNVYMATTSSNPRSVSFTGPSGSGSVDLGY